MAQMISAGDGVRVRQPQEFMPTEIKHSLQYTLLLFQAAYKAMAPTDTRVVHPRLL